MASRAIRTTLPDGRTALSNVIDKFTGESIQLVKIPSLPNGVSTDGIIYFQTNDSTWGVELWERSISNKTLHIKWFGAKPDGVTDNTTIINTALSLCEGKSLIFEEGEYLITNTLLINKEGTKIVGNNTTIKLTLFSNTICSITQSNITIENLRIEGNGYLVPNSNSRGISIEGPSSNSYLEDITINNVNISNIGWFGIVSRFLKNSTISNCNINGVGYSGIHNYSGNNIKVTKCTVNDITGNSGLGYGIVFTRTADNSDLIGHPRSKNCIAEDCLVTNNLQHEGFDTHGGDNIKFIRCNTINCNVGIALVNATNEIGSNAYASHNCIVENCEIIGNYSGNSGPGISVAGTNDSSELATYNTISNNIVKGHGTDGTNILGGIRFRNTQGLVIVNNTVIECWETGITIYTENYNYKVSDNIIDNVLSSVSPNASCISERSNNVNVGEILNNTTLRSNGSLANYVSEIGVRLQGTNSTRHIIIGRNECPTVQSSLFNNNATFGSLGGGRYIYNVNGSPEGEITALRGSLAINLLSSRGYSLWVKEVGSGNTGWTLVQMAASGTTGFRPTEVVIGSMWFDTTLEQPIWWDGTNWIDAAGSTV